MPNGRRSCKLLLREKSREVVLFSRMRAGVFNAFKADSDFDGAPDGIVEYRTIQGMQKNNEYF
jgi:hypothetical protein